MGRHRRRYRARYRDGLYSRVHVFVHACVSAIALVANQRYCALRVLQCTYGLHTAESKQQCPFRIADDNNSSLKVMSSQYAYPWQQKRLARLLQKTRWHGKTLYRMQSTHTLLKKLHCIHGRTIGMCARILSVCARTERTKVTYKRGQEARRTDLTIPPTAHVPV